MTLADYTLYAIWFIFPLFFYTLALWGKLERLSGNRNREDPVDYLRNGSILLLCALASLFFDLYLLDSLLMPIVGELLMPRTFYRIILFPIVLLLAAKILGPSKEIKIARAPDLNTLKGRRRK